MIFDLRILVDWLLKFDLAADFFEKIPSISLFSKFDVRV